MRMPLGGTVSCKGGPNITESNGPGGPLSADQMFPDSTIGNQL